MKKQYFILLAIAGMSAIRTVNAQNTPIDDFLKKYPSREWVTQVSMSQQMLQAIFTQGIARARSLNVPEAYGSVSVSKASNNASNMYTDFIKHLLSAKYEQIMEVNRENSDILAYYMRKVNNNTNEIVVLRQQIDRFSVIYIKGEIGLNNVDVYLTMIRDDLMSKNKISFFDIQPA